MSASPKVSTTEPGSDAHSRKYAERKAEIIDLAAVLFAANGYASTSVNDLCDAAQLGKGGLYYYIGSKEDLLVEIHERVMRPLLEQSQAIAAGEGSPVARLWLVSRSLLTLIVERLDHVWVFLHEYRVLKGERLERFRSRRHAFEQVISDLLHEGVAAGQLAVEDFRMTTLAFLGMHNYTYQWIRPGGHPGPDELSSFYCRLFFSGTAVATLDVDAVEREVVHIAEMITRAAP